MRLIFIFVAAFIPLISVLPSQANEFQFDPSEDGVTPISDADKAAFLRKLALRKRVILPGDIEDKLAAIFLKVRNNNTKAAVALMEKAARFYTDNKGEGNFLGESILPADMQDKMRKNDIVTVLPYRMKDNKRIILLRFSAWSPDNTQYTMEDIFRQIYLFHLVLLLEPKTVQNGVKILVDYTGFDGESSRNHMFLKIWKITKVLSFFMNAMVLNCDTTEIINPPKYLGTLLAWGKGLGGGYLPVNYHTTMESLHKQIPRDYLPVHYGGTLPLTDEDLKTSNWLPALEGQTAWVQNWTRLQYR